MRVQNVLKENHLFAEEISVFHIIGYTVLGKFGKNYNAKNPSVLSSTCLRKHLVTLFLRFGGKKR